MTTKTNPRRSNGHRRNKVRARVLREETECWLCGQSVDTTLPPGLPTSPEVDEVVPVSRGGDPYDRANCRLAHRLCNQRRGNGTRGHRAPAVEVIATSRTW
ncbi:HNH endonuclease [Nocardioides panzhihuensis]|uniref:5-methylcytosine-specific restriction endonuclease McrA n=1 Tax=Nocardioides panzhihuensis TaxID=860243 RepID=A0A7Z0ITC6_9ACTN|nr:HNH endonuclease [Nocardioides panzhihuensis]NYI78712.1 5-methylcytosine-specific restriction endonuclease McrA [Nocardioides panzhihuensis]